MGQNVASCRLVGVPMVYSWLADYLVCYDYREVVGLSQLKEAVEGSVEFLLAFRKRLTALIFWPVLAYDGVHDDEFRVFLGCEGEAAVYQPS